MNARIWAAATLGLGITLASAQSAAALIIVEPDDFAEGTDLRTAMPGVTLSVEGKPASEVRSVDSYSAFNGRRLATTGALVFGQYPEPSVTVPQGWDEPVLGRLRVDFAMPATFVQIDLIYDDDDYGSLWAYDQNDVLLDVVTFYGDGRGSVPSDTMDTASITRPQGDIAYVLAGGRDNESLFLDNLQVELAPMPAPEPATIALAALGLTALGFTHRRRK